MAHIKDSYTNLSQPQDVNIDKIVSQIMFKDNIDALNLILRSLIGNIKGSVNSITELKALNTTDIVLYPTGAMISVVGKRLMYILDRTSSAVNNDNDIIQPTVGVGRWISLGSPLVHNHNKSQITDFPASMPASDVYGWAKASVKPAYTASEVGAISVALKGANNGVAELDSSGKVPSSQLPSYIGTGNIDCGYFGEVDENDDIEDITLQAHIVDSNAHQNIIIDGNMN